MRSSGSIPRRSKRRFMAAQVAAQSMSRLRITSGSSFCSTKHCVTKVVPRTHSSYRWSHNLTTESMQIRRGGGGGERQVLKSGLIE